LVRVNADARPDIVLARGGGDHLIPFAPAGRDVEKTADAGLAGAGDHALLVLDQPLVFEMAVRIDQHQASSVGISKRGNTPIGCATRKPVATRSANQASFSSAAKSRSSAATPIWSSSLSIA